MAQFGRIINNYQRAKASSERVYGLMNEPGRLDDAGSFINPYTRSLEAFARW